MTAPTGRVEDGGMVGDCWDVDGGWRVVCLDPGDEDADCAYVHTPHSMDASGIGDAVAMTPAALRDLAAVLAAAADRVDSFAGWWSYEQAGEYCGGVTAGAYRSYVHRQGAPRAERYDPGTGRRLVRADLVREWHANRKGRGNWR